MRPKVFVLMRHGETLFSLEDRFTGCIDCDLTHEGVCQARVAGKLLKEKGYKFDQIYTSSLRRTIHTATLIREVMGQRPECKLIKSALLNEKHCGVLQGMTRAEALSRFGNEKLHLWSQTYSARPPSCEEAALRHKVERGPLSQEVGESLEEVGLRAFELWKTEIGPAIDDGKSVLIISHKNTLRGLMKHLLSLSDLETLLLQISVASPRYFQITKKLSSGAPGCVEL